MERKVGESRLGQKRGGGEEEKRGWEKI